MAPKQARETKLLIKQLDKQLKATTIKGFDPPIWTSQNLNFIAQKKMRNKPIDGNSLTLITIPYGKEIMYVILLPEVLVCPILKHLNERTHNGRNALMDAISPHLKGPHL